MSEGSEQVAGLPIVDASAPTLSGFRLKAYVVSVDGFGSFVFDAVSPGRARADAFQASAFNGWTFKDFLKRSRLWRSPPRANSNYGREIMVGGERAFYVGGNAQYIRFVRPGQDFVLSAHPYDVEPKELRPFHYRDDLVDDGALAPEREPSATGSDHEPPDE